MLKSGFAKVTGRMPVKKYTKKRASLSVDFEFDETDKPPNGFHVTKFDIFALVYSIVVHVVDVGFDINVAYHYFKTGYMVHFGFTMFFMFVPAFLITLLSLRMYIADCDEVAMFGNAVRRKVFCVFVLLLQLAPVMRYCDSLNYALRSRRAAKQGDRAKQEKYYRLMLNEDSDVALLRVFECYLESAPQQILQICLLLLDSSQGSAFHSVQQGLSIASSFLSLAWCMASYHRSVRFDLDNKENLSWPGTSVQFLWHLNVTISRILAISAVASLFPVWVGIAVIAHWFAMTIWVATIDNTAFCGQSKFVEIFFAFSVGLVYIFNFIGIKDGPSRGHYLFFYPICFLENLAAVALWASYIDTRTHSSWYFIPLIVVPLVTFVLGMIFLVMYYRFFHPSMGVMRRKKLGGKVPTPDEKPCLDGNVENGGGDL